MNEFSRSVVGVIVFCIKYCFRLINLRPFKVQKLDFSQPQVFRLHAVYVQLLPYSGVFQVKDKHWACNSSLHS